jgi:hypothetical protein
MGRMARCLQGIGFLLFHKGSGGLIGYRDALPTNQVKMQLV